jgi:hypothetical protein
VCGGYRHRNFFLHPVDHVDRLLLLFDALWSLCEWWCECEWILICYNDAAGCTWW